MVARKNRFLLVAILFLLLGIGVMIGASYALFTQNITIKTHLDAGKLDAKLVRIAHTNEYLDNDGYITTVTVNEEEVEYTGNNESNAFGLPDGALIVPTCVEQGVFKIMNNEGNVAFDYYLEFKYTTGKDSDSSLAEQLTVLVEELEENAEGKLVPTEHKNTFTMDELNESQFLIEQSGDTVPTVGTVDKSTSCYFRVTVTFEDDGINEESARTASDAMNNNNAEDQHVYFDMIVHCVQNTERK